MIELSPYHLWPCVLVGAFDQAHLREAEGVKFIHFNDTLLDCRLLANGGYRLYENACVFTNGHRKGGAADLDRLGSPIHRQVGWIVAPYWENSTHEVRGYLCATGIQHEFEALEREGRLTEQKLSHSLITDNVRIRRSDGYCVHLVQEIKRVKSVDLLPMDIWPATSGRLLERRYFPELVAIAQGKEETAAAIRRSLCIAEAIKQAREILSRPDPQPVRLTTATTINGPRRRERIFTPFVSIKPVR
jgi:hypothetical protein